MALKFSESNGYGTTVAEISAIDYAISTGVVSVINANILNNANGYNIDIDDANICQNNGVSGPGTFAGR